MSFKHTIESKRKVSLGLIKFHSNISDEDYGLLVNDNNLKWCSVCRKCIPREDFYLTKSKSDGLTQYCKPCTRKKGVEQRQTEKYKIANRHRNRKYKYGLSKDEYSKLLTKNPFCQICERVFNDKRYPCVDHDHKNNKVRGILCDTCNRGIGYFQEDITSLLNTVRYLRGQK